MTEERLRLSELTEDSMWGKLFQRMAHWAAINSYVAILLYFAEGPEKLGVSKRLKLRNRKMTEICALDLSNVCASQSSKKEEIIENVRGNVAGQPRDIWEDAKYKERSKQN